MTKSTYPLKRDKAEAGQSTKIKHLEKNFGKPNIFLQNIDMKTIISISLLLTALFLVSEAVQVQDGEYSFSSDSVRVLQSLLDKSSVSKKQNPHLIKTSYAAVCGNPTLPQEFIELCHKSDFALVFSRLAKINMDICDICGFAACTGC